MIKTLADACNYFFSLLESNTSLGSSVSNILPLLYTSKALKVGFPARIKSGQNFIVAKSKKNISLWCFDQVSIILTIWPHRLARRLILAMTMYNFLNKNEVVTAKLIAIGREWTTFNTRSNDSVIVCLRTR